jgi:hypothetical protein
MAGILCRSIERTGARPIIKTENNSKKRNMTQLTFSNGGFPFVVNHPQKRLGLRVGRSGNLASEVAWHRFKTNPRYREEVGVWWHNNLRGRHLLGGGGMPLAWIKELKRTKAGTFSARDRKHLCATFKYGRRRCNIMKNADFLKLRKLYYRRGGKSTGKSATRPTDLHLLSPGKHRHTPGHVTGKHRHSPGYLTDSDSDSDSDSDAPQKKKKNSKKKSKAKPKPKAKPKAKPKPKKKAKPKPKKKAKPKPKEDSDSDSDSDLGMQQDSDSDSDWD